MRMYIEDVCVRAYVRVRVSVCVSCVYLCLYNIYNICI